MTVDTGQRPVSASSLWLLCRAAGLACALPAAAVGEVMRQLPIDPLAGMPEFVLGVSVIRGAPIPVIDAARLLAAERARAEYFVILDVGGRALALAVASVIGLRPLAAETLAPLPPLLQRVAEDALAAIDARDGELLLLLDAARVVPPALLAELTAAAARR